MVSLTKEDKNPKGRLIASGRRKYNQATNGNLKPGVKKPVSKMSTSEMKRKGSFLRRHYAGPSKPLKDEKGRPTRHSLQATAWGEPAPSTQDAVRRLAEKGKRLLERAKSKEKKK